jgi:hypothetical protein
MWPGIPRWAQQNEHKCAQTYRDGTSVVMLIRCWKACASAS